MFFWPQRLPWTVVATPNPPHLLEIFCGDDHLQLRLVEVEVVAAKIIERDGAIAFISNQLVSQMQAPTQCMTEA